MIDDDKASKNGKAKPDRDEEEELATMRKRLRYAQDAYSDSREDQLDDLRFYAGSPDNQWQWPADVLQTRGSVQGQTINARPCLTVNKLPAHVRQITNELRKNRPSGKVIPADDKGDIKVAEIMDGIVRHIEYISDADVCYDTACENQVIFGEGYVRLVTDYVDDDSFDQDIKIMRVRNSFSVYMDPTTQDPCGADAKWCFVTEDYAMDDYEREFPDAAPISSLQTFGIGDDNLASWIRDDSIRIAEYFYVEYEPAVLNLYPNNQTAFKGSKEAKQFQQMGLPVVKTRDVQRRVIKWCKTNGYEFLDEKEWPGKWIPVVKVPGNEFEVNGEVFTSGIVRNSKDAQRMYNYWVSSETEMLALAPKAPFIGYGGQFEGYEQQWKTANTTSWPYLEVNPDAMDGSGKSFPLPQRASPPMAQMGLIEAKKGASEDIKTTTGQYDTSLGAQSNERTGKAIQARTAQSDISTYHYGDNLGRAVRYVTRQIVDLIPKIYDTQRVARIIGMDGETDTAMIDPNQPQPMREIRDQNNPDVVIAKIYNPGVGKYDVSVTVGASYITKRQEALDAMQDLLKTNPQLWAVAGDLFIKNMDWPGAQEMAQRFAKTIDPKLTADEDKSPALQHAEQQIQAMGKELDQLHQMLQQASNSIEAQDVQRKDFEAKIKAFDAETKRIQALAAGMQPEQIQDIVMGTLHAALANGDILGNQTIAPQMASRGAMPMQEAPGQPQAPAGPPQPGEAPVAPGQGYSPLTPAWAPYQSNPDAPIRGR
jgi:hypothetical protein